MEDIGAVGGREQRPVLVARNSAAIAKEKVQEAVYDECK